MKLWSPRRPAAYTFLLRAMKMVETAMRKCLNFDLFELGGGGGGVSKF